MTSTILMAWYLEKIKTTVFCRSQLANLSFEKENLSTDYPNLKNFIIGDAKIQHQNRKTVIVKSFKYKGMLAAVNIETILEYKEGHWICNGSGITGIS